MVAESRKIEDFDGYFWWDFVIKSQFWLKILVWNDLISPKTTKNPKFWVEVLVPTITIVPWTPKFRKPCLHLMITVMSFFLAIMVPFNWAPTSDSFVHGFPTMRRSKRNPDVICYFWIQLDNVRVLPDSFCQDPVIWSISNRPRTK